MWDFFKSLKYTRIDFSRAHPEDSPPPTYFLLGYFFFFVNQVLLKDENWLPLSIWPHNRWTVKMNLGNRCRAIQWWWNQISNIFLHYRYKLCRKYVRVISIFFLEADTLGKSNPQETIQNSGDCYERATYAESAINFFVEGLKRTSHLSVVSIFKTVTWENPTNFFVTQGVGTSYKVEVWGFIVMAKFWPILDRFGPKIE